MDDELGAALARTVRGAREGLGLSAQALADEAGISRAMLAKIERAQASPTAQLLARLSGALGLSLSELISRSEQPASRLSRRATQQLWVDPDAGYRRRSVSPASAVLDIVEVELPAGARVDAPAPSYRFITQQILVLDGELVFVEGAVEHRLGIGDCLELGPPSDCAFINDTVAPCRYLVVLAKRLRPASTPSSG